MRGVLLGLLICLAPAMSLAAADAACVEQVRDCARECSLVIEAACAAVKYTPRCDWPEHQCAITRCPAAGCSCSEPPCHQPVVTCEPCSCAPLTTMCHQPVTPLLPCDTCPGEPPLTGGRHLLTEGCADCCT